LAMGTLLASLMGTTGAAMLMIRPFLRANSHREERTFMAVFFIFLVANAGGALTPLGDPPLFLGFLRGVPFFWTLRLLPHMAVIACFLLAVYFVLDTYHYRKEGMPVRPDKEAGEKLRIEGAFNFLFLIAVIGTVLMSGKARWGELSVLGVRLGIQELARDGALVFLTLLSLFATPARIHEDNEFTWFPMKEVAILFAGVFLTMAPCLRILQAGARGELSFLVTAAHEPSQYFWITGALSSLLDNAPTYLTFLSVAAGNYYPGVTGLEAVSRMAGERALYLEAISAGAVFFGAVTYIGNAPNFLIRSIAEEAGIRMPGFFGYMLKYSLVILLPVFIVITFVFF
ncbi:MAG TPA: sodium:proton antiporter, partial [Dissulfurispiraceae bacterium]